MAKQQYQNKVAKNTKGESMLEQNALIDDNLLPNAIELEKLKEVDPKIIDWILERTEIEQNARIQFNNDRVRLAEYDLIKTHSFNKTSLWFGFLIFIAVLGLSGFLIYNDLNVAGTIFGGTAIIGGAVFFIKAAIASKKQGK